ncbi:hypothetical protein [Epilithonimonas arachidiradicis]|uniref:Glycosyltransferase RgtA/B/C/D-like domain-containing protein n=1 Tax=Epilithonimonas arachidiradicis TaxID=1617282 RepID=A0A420D9H6_9FLAO|nr:hypothetical protein [Epilithonimonas arachidiradicis]RKE87682.1 hypothetical protein BXY58_1813 [Epilithonimonas arachidiradicis]GGG57119.1 hypothetical protein GCM10007332_18500 [Epilithonimonas arachidiradicis]
MISVKLNSKYEKILQTLLIIITYVMIIFRFLSNEKGRVSPDSIRYMRQADVFPVIDNTTAPLGYPLFIKFFTFFGLDEFWSSKLVGVLAYTFILIFAYRRKFYFKELLVTSALFSFVSIFSFTMSEALTLPFVILFFFTARQIIKNRISQAQGIFFLTLLLILLLNIRYSALFLCAGSIGFGLLKIGKHYWKSFAISGVLGIGFYGLYKVTFIDYFNENYINMFLEIGLKPTSQLLVELFQGLTTTFNPFIHIADPNGGAINYGIYGIGLLTILVMIFLFIRNRLSETERFILLSSLVTIILSYFIQYVYSVNAIDYRLLAPFSIGIWMVFFRKIFQIFDDTTYAVAFMSLATGFVFSWLSKGDYIENRKAITRFLKEEKMMDKKLLFFMKDQMDNDGQTAELISTVNPHIYITFKPSDTLKKDVLTRYKVEKKIRIKKNNYQ